MQSSGVAGLANGSTNPTFSKNPNVNTSKLPPVEVDAGARNSEAAIHRKRSSALRSSFRDSDASTNANSLSRRRGSLSFVKKSTVDGQSDLEKSGNEKRKSGEESARPSLQTAMTHAPPSAQQQPSNRWTFMLHDPADIEKISPTSQKLLNAHQSMDCCSVLTLALQLSNKDLIDLRIEFQKLMEQTIMLIQSKSHIELEGDNNVDEENKSLTTSLNTSGVAIPKPSVSSLPLSPLTIDDSPRGPTLLLRKDTMPVGSPTTATKRTPIMADANPSLNNLSLSENPNQSLEKQQSSTADGAVKIALSSFHTDRVLAGLRVFPTFDASSEADSNKSRRDRISGTAAADEAADFANRTPLTSLARIRHHHFLECFALFFSRLADHWEVKRAELNEEFSNLKEAQKQRRFNAENRMAMRRLVAQPNTTVDLKALKQQQQIQKEQRSQLDKALRTAAVRDLMGLPDDQLSQRLHTAEDALEGVTETCEVLSYCCDLKFLSRLFFLIDCSGKGYVTWDEVTNFCLDGAVLAKVHGETADALCEWLLEPDGIRGISHRPHKLKPMGTTENLIILDRSDAVYSFDPTEEKSTIVAATGSLVKTTITSIEYIPSPMDLFVIATTGAELVVFDPNTSATGANLMNFERISLPHPVMVMAWCDRMERLLCGDRHGRVASYAILRSKWKRLLPPVFDAVVTTHARSTPILERKGVALRHQHSSGGGDESTSKKKGGDHNSREASNSPNRSPSPSPHPHASNSASAPSAGDATKEIAAVAISVHRLNGTIVVAFEDGLCQVLTPPYSATDFKTFVTIGRPLCSIGIAETQGAVVIGTSEPKPEVWSLAACEDTNVKPHLLVSRNNRHESPIIAVTTFVDSDQCFSLDFLGLVKVWDLRTNAPLQHFKLELKDPRIGWVAMQGSGAGDAIYCCDRQSVIVFRKSDDVKASANALFAKKSKQSSQSTSHADAGAAEDPERQLLITQQKNALRQLNVEAGDVGANVVFSAYSPITQKFISTTGKRICYHDLYSGKLVSEADVLGGTGSNVAAMLSGGALPSTEVASAAGLSNTGKSIFQHLQSKREITAAILDKNGGRIFCGLSTGAVIVFNTASGGLVEAFPYAHGGSPVECFTYIDHLNCPVSCARDGSGSYLYRPPLNEFESKVPLGGANKNATFSADDLQQRASTDPTVSATAAAGVASNPFTGGTASLHLAAYPAFRCMTGCVMAYVGAPTYLLLAADSDGRVHAFDCQRFDPSGANSVSPLFVMTIPIGSDLKLSVASGSGLNDEEAKRKSTAFTDVVKKPPRGLEDANSGSMSLSTMLNAVDGGGGGLSVNFSTTTSFGGGGGGTGNGGGYFHANAKKAAMQSKLKVGSSTANPSSQNTASSSSPTDLTETYDAEDDLNTFMTSTMGTNSAASPLALLQKAAEQLREARKKKDETDVKNKRYAQSVNKALRSKSFKGNGGKAGSGMETVSTNTTLYSTNGLLSKSGGDSGGGDAVRATVTIGKRQVGVRDAAVTEAEAKKQDDEIIENFMIGAPNLHRNKTNTAGGSKSAESQKNGAAATASASPTNPNVQTVIGFVVFKNQEHIIVGDPRRMTLLRLDRTARMGIILGQWVMDTGISPTVLRNPHLLLEQHNQQKGGGGYAAGHDPLVSSIHLDTTQNILFAVYDSRTIVAIDVNSLVPAPATAEEIEVRRAKADLRRKQRSEKLIRKHQKSIERRNRRMFLGGEGSESRERELSTASSSGSPRVMNATGAFKAFHNNDSRENSLVRQSSSHIKRSIVDSFAQSIDADATVVDDDGDGSSARKPFNGNASATSEDSSESEDDLSDLLDAPDPQPRWFFQVKTHSPVVSMEFAVAKSPVADCFPPVTFQRPEGIAPPSYHVYLFEQARGAREEQARMEKSRQLALASIPMSISQRRASIAKAQQALQGSNNEEQQQHQHSLPAFTHPNSKKNATSASVAGSVSVLSVINTFRNASKSSATTQHGGADLVGIVAGPVTAEAVANNRQLQQAVHQAVMSKDGGTRFIATVAYMDGFVDLFDAAADLAPLWTSSKVWTKPVAPEYPHTLEDTLLVQTFVPFREEEVDASLRAAGGSGSFSFPNSNGHPAALNTSGGEGARVRPSSSMLASVRPRSVMTIGETSAPAPSSAAASPLAADSPTSAMTSRASSFRSGGLVFDDPLTSHALSQSLQNEADRLRAFNKHRASATSVMFSKQLTQSLRRKSAAMRDTWRRASQTFGVAGTPTATGFVASSPFSPSQQHLVHQQQMMSNSSNAQAFGFGFKPLPLTNNGAVSPSSTSAGGGGERSNSIFLSSSYQSDSNYVMDAAAFGATPPTAVFNKAGGALKRGSVHFIEADGIDGRDAKKESQQQAGEAKEEASSNAAQVLPAFPLKGDSRAATAADVRLGTPPMTASHPTQSSMTMGTDSNDLKAVSPSAPTSTPSVTSKPSSAASGRGGSGKASRVVVVDAPEVPELPLTARGRASATSSSGTEVGGAGDASQKPSPSAVITSAPFALSTVFAATSQQGPHTSIGNRLAMSPSKLQQDAANNDDDDDDDEDKEERRRRSINASFSAQSQTQMRLLKHNSNLAGLIKKPVAEKSASNSGLAFEKLLPVATSTAFRPSPTSKTSTRGSPQMRPSVASTATAFNVPPPTTKTLPKVFISGGALTTRVSPMPTAHELTAATGALSPTRLNNSSVTATTSSALVNVTSSTTNSTTALVISSSSPPLLNEHPEDDEGLKARRWLELQLSSLRRGRVKIKRTHKKKRGRGMISEPRIISSEAIRLKHEKKNKDATSSTGGSDDGAAGFEDPFESVAPLGNPQRHTDKDEKDADDDDDVAEGNLLSRKETSMAAFEDERQRAKAAEAAKEHDFFKQVPKFGYDPKRSRRPREKRTNNALQEDEDLAEQRALQLELSISMKRKKARTKSKNSGDATEKTKMNEGGADDDGDDDFANLAAKVDGTFDYYAERLKREMHGELKDPHSQRSKKKAARSASSAGVGAGDSEASSSLSSASSSFDSASEYPSDEDYEWIDDEGGAGEADDIDWAPERLDSGELGMRRRRKKGSRFNDGHEIALQIERDKRAGLIPLFTTRQGIPVYLSEDMTSVCVPADDVLLHQQMGLNNTNNSTTRRGATSYGGGRVRRERTESVSPTQDEIASMHALNAQRGRANDNFHLVGANGADLDVDDLTGDEDGFGGSSRRSKRRRNRLYAKSESARGGRSDGIDTTIEFPDTTLRAIAEGPGGVREYAVIASFRNQDPRSTTKQDKAEQVLTMLRKHHNELEDFADKLKMGSRYVRRRRPEPEQVLSVSTSLGRRLLLSEKHQHTGAHTDVELRQMEEADRKAKEIAAATSVTGGSGDLSNIGGGAGGPRIASPLLELAEGKRWWTRTPVAAVPTSSRGANRRRDEARGGGGSGDDDDYRCAFEGGKGHNPFDEDDADDATSSGSEGTHHHHPSTLRHARHSRPLTVLTSAAGRGKKPSTVLQKIKNERIRNRISDMKSGKGRKEDVSSSLSLPNVSRISNGKPPTTPSKAQKKSGVGSGDQIHVEEQQQQRPLLVEDPSVENYSGSSRANSPPSSPSHLQSSGQKKQHHHHASSSSPARPSAAVVTTATGSVVVVQPNTLHSRGVGEEPKPSPVDHLPPTSIKGIERSASVAARSLLPFQLLALNKTVAKVPQGVRPLTRQGGAVAAGVGGGAFMSTNRITLAAINNGSGTGHHRLPSHPENRNTSGSSTALITTASANPQSMASGSHSHAAVTYFAAASTANVNNRGGQESRLGRRVTRTPALGVPRSSSSATNNSNAASSNDHKVGHHKNLNRMVDMSLEVKHIPSDLFDVSNYHRDFLGVARDGDDGYGHNVLSKSAPSATTMRASSPPLSSAANGGGLLSPLTRGRTPLPLTPGQRRHQQLREEAELLAEQRRAEEERRERAGLLSSQPANSSSAALSSSLKGSGGNRPPATTKEGRSVNW